ncbi:MAG: 16S rRNA processing protein RimM [Lachnospiraceae bacterium]|jgi:16S rRNA processing protein RimM|nr:16S rRNA processing protein RimM [Lachnospiraceae bacterium]MBQ6542095.1 16S rRNA processing protein RimM [Lachnospiraceae bacterium]MBR5339465.1 16S rRNA processing protein RimM [Lachnospiraceae bacterium]
MARTEFLRIGVVTSPHGVRGEVRVYPTTDEISRFSEVGTLLLEKEGVRSLRTIESVKQLKGMVALKLSGIDSVEEAEKIRNADLLIRRDQSSPLKEGQYFIGDLLDLLAVREDGTEVGTVEDVLKTGANSVLVIKKKDGKELLLPVIPDCVLSVDSDEGIMTIHVLPGLED